MIEFNIDGQVLKCKKPTVVADTVNYLEAEFTFSSDWDSVSKYINFSKGQEVYDLEILDNKISGLNLGEGYWSVSVHGENLDGESVTKRITTNVIDFYVVESGLIGGEPFPSVNPSIGERFVQMAKAEVDRAQDIADNLKIDVDKKMEYYIVRCEMIGENYVIIKDGVTQTYAMLKSAFDDEKLFLYLIYNGHIYIPSIDISTGIIFSDATIYRETDDMLYTEADRILVTTSNAVSYAHVASERLDNKTPEMPVDGVEGLTEVEKARLYPSVGAVEQFVDEKIDALDIPVIDPEVGVSTNKAYGNTVSIANNTWTTYASTVLPVGSWIITVDLNFSGSTTGKRRGVRVYDNEAKGAVAGSTVQIAIPSSSSAVRLQAVGMLSVSGSGKTIAVQAYQDTGSALNVTSGNIKYMRIK